MTKSLLLFLTAYISLAHAQELSVVKLRSPVFDAAGHMTRRITAQSASGPIDTPKLKEGVVEFYSSSDASTTVATFSFIDATYRRLIGTVDGEGHASFHSKKGDLAGDGFSYQIREGQLLLRSHVTGLLGTTQMEGNQGEATISQVEPSKEWILSKASINGSIVVKGIDTDAYKFERAETESAVYTEADDTLVLASPVTFWLDGKKSINGADDIRITNVSKGRAKH